MSDKSKKEGFLEKVDKSGCGTFQFTMKLISSIISFIIFCIVAIVVFRLKTNKTAKTNGTITNASCSSRLTSTEKNTTQLIYDCNLDVNYNVNNIDYSGNLTTSESTQYTSGTNINLEYDPSNPKDFQKASPIKSKTVSYILFCIASLILICMIVHIVLYKKSIWYQRYLCVELAAQTIGMVSHSISN